MNDALFKSIFKKNSDITLALINSVFEFQGTTLISDIEFIDRNLDAEEEDGKDEKNISTINNYVFWLQCFCYSSDSAKS